MQRVILIVLCLVLAAWCALGGEALKDSEGRALVPVAKLNCAPLFEVKAVSMTLCRVVGTPEYAIVVTVTFIHHESSTSNVNVTCDFGQSNIFRTSSLDKFCEKVKPNTATSARFLAERPKWSDACAGIRFTPTFTFSFTR